MYFKRLGDLRQEQLKDETERKYSEESNHEGVIHSNANEYNTKKIIKLRRINWIQHLANLWKLGKAALV